YRSYHRELHTNNTSPQQNKIFCPAWQENLDLYNSMDKVQPGVLIFLLVILKVFGPTEASCSTARYCQFNRLKLTSIPQDLPRHGDILVCEASGIPTPDITVTLSSGLNKTVQSGGRMTVGANSTIIINVTADAAGLYVCTATNPVGSKFASLFVYARQENPKTLEPGLEKPRNLTLEPARKTESSNDPQDNTSVTASQDQTALSEVMRTSSINPQYESTVSEHTYEDMDSLSPTGPTDPKTANVTDQTALGPTDPNSNGCTATDNTDNITASQDQTVLGQHRNEPANRQEEGLSESSEKKERKATAVTQKRARLEANRQTAHPGSDLKARAPTTQAGPASLPPGVHPAPSTPLRPDCDHNRHQHHAIPQTDMGQFVLPG
ncbi:hypothetical protein Bbelb_378250, partial [Branchiostoma belcheri]